MVAAVHKVVEQVSVPQRAHTILMQQGYKPDFDQQNPTHTITIIMYSRYSKRYNDVNLDITYIKFITPCVRMCSRGISLSFN